MVTSPLTSVSSTLEAGVVQLYLIDIAAMAPNLPDPQSIPFLSDGEQERVDKYRFLKDKYAHGIGRFAIRWLSAEILGQGPGSIQIEKGQYGKPFLTDFPELQINISHSGDLILIGLCRDNAIGVDVEKYKWDIDHLDLANAVFSKLEIHSLRRLTKANRIHGFYRCWTKKESYIKAKGKGLQIPLDQFSVPIMDDGRSHLHQVTWDPDECFRWQTFNFSVKTGYAAACCSSPEVKAIAHDDITRLISRAMQEAIVRET